MSSSSSSSSSAELSLASTYTLNNGRTIPRVGLGTWRADPGQVEASVVAAINAGVRHIDCAAMYGNEKEVGQGIAKALASSSPVLRRSDLFVTSKVWNTHHAAAGVATSIATSLRDLQTEYLDLVLIHWPVAWTNESTVQNKVWANVSIKETWQALEDAVAKGQVRSIGVSNFSEKEIEEILTFAKFKPVTNQVETHPYLNQATLKEFEAKHGIIHSTYSPLGNIRPENFETCPLNEPLFVDTLASKYSRTPAQLLLRWQLQQGNVVLFKSTRAERIAENTALFDFEISEADMKEIQKLGTDKYKRYVNPMFRQDNAHIFPK